MEYNTVKDSDWLRWDHWKGYQEGSQAHLNFLPKRNGFYFSVIAEEFGFVGVLVMLVIFIFILVRCLYLAFDARDRFCRLTIGGLNPIFISTIFINLGMVVGIIPVVGMPLPFISKGSSLLSFYIALVVLFQWQRTKN